MAVTDSRVTIHMAASLDGFIARANGELDWLRNEGDEYRERGELPPLRDLPVW